MLQKANSMLDNYYNFFQTFNVLGLAIGLMIGSNLKDVAGDFIDDILMPFINPLIKGFQKGNGKDKEKGINVQVPGTKIVINLERVIASTIKFLALSLIIFGMLQFGVKIKKPTQWVSVRNWDGMYKAAKSFPNAMKILPKGAKNLPKINGFPKAVMTTKIK
tara:strand:+ start:2816 stop:3301 length:486 start_codon:yes stop_codon:yes gene_type:complete